MMDSGKVKFDYAQHTIDCAKRDLPKEADTIDLVIAAIEADICDRRGIKHEWRQIEQNIIDNEIKPMWKSILTKLVVDKAERDPYSHTNKVQAEVIGELKRDLRMVRESQERQRQLNDKLTLERDELKGKLGKAVERLKSWPKWEWREGSYKPREDFKRTEAILLEIEALKEISK